MMQPFILIQGLRTGQITHASRSTTLLLLTISRGFPTTFSGPLSDGHAAVLRQVGRPHLAALGAAKLSAPHRSRVLALLAGGASQASPPSLCR
jgi:hypothetical protein